MSVVEKELDDPHTRKVGQTFLGYTDDFVELGKQEVDVLDQFRFTAHMPSR